MAAHTPGGWIPGALALGSWSSSREAADRTPNVGVVPDDAEPVPRHPLFREPVLVAAGHCGCCGGPIDSAGHCGCST